MTNNAQTESSCCSTTAPEAPTFEDRKNLLADSGCCGGGPSEQSITEDDIVTEHQHGYISDKQAYLRRMGRIEGQARGISKMVAEEKYCIDILTQVSALTRALQGVATGLLDDHLKHCVLDAAKLGDDEAAAKLQEASDAISRLIRS